MFNTPSLRVLDVTALISPDGFVVARAVDDARLHALRTALLALHARPDGAAALAALLQAERLVAVQSAIVRDLQRLPAHAPPP